MQSKLPLVQLEDVSLHSSTCQLRKEIDTHLTTTSSQLIRKSSEDSSQPLFLQTKRPQFLQPFLKHFVFQSRQQLHYSSLNAFQQLSVFLVMRETEPKTEHSICGASLTSPISPSFWLRDWHDFMISGSADKGPEVWSAQYATWIVLRERGWNGVEEWCVESSEDAENMNHLQYCGEPQVTCECGRTKKETWAAVKRKKSHRKHIYHN